jgi:mannitol/fructose-specific phosphotransferase system IIA component (Ntr-type)
MAEKLNEKELMTFKELLIANSVQIDALAQLLIEKGIITEREFFAKLKQVKLEYEAKKAKG